MDCVCLTAKVRIFISIPVKNSWEFQGLTQVVAIADPYHFERNAFYIGRGVTMLSRAGIFRASGGIAVDMNSRVFKLPSFYGMIFYFNFLVAPCFLFLVLLIISISYLTLMMQIYFSGKSARCLSLIIHRHGVQFKKCLTALLLIICLSFGF